VDGDSGEVVVTLAGDRERHLSDVYSVAVDEERKRLYIADRQELLVVGTDDWALLGATPVDATTYNTGLAVDPIGGLAYLLDSAGGQLVVLAD
jgi:DNA-binding beta-propeller fold protein YncE